MAGKPWWSMKPGPERRAAKEAYFACCPELPEVPKGRAPVEFTLDGQKGFVGPAGFFWPYDTDLEKKVVRILAQSDLHPSPLVQVTEEDGVIHLVGRSGLRRPVDDLGRLFKVFYSAMTETEATLAKRETKPSRFSSAESREAKS